MKLDTPIRTLGPVDHMPLKTAVSKVRPEAWLEDTLRQRAFADYHSQTQSIIVLFADGWPDIKISRRSGWTYFSNEVIALAQEITRKHYPDNGILLRAMVAKLLAGAEIASHQDTHPSFAVAHRIHVPLITNDLVEFTVGGQAVHLEEGIAYEISNLDFHAVANRSKEDRVHFIFDYVVK